MYPNDTGILNPLFISTMVSLLAIGGATLNRWLKKNHPEMESPITFCSDRKRVSLLPSEIVYVESCDTEVLIHASDGRKLRNKTGIAKWESVLGEPFIRIHRAFLVNSNYVSSYKSDTLIVGEETLPVSRKYQKQLKDLLSDWLRVTCPVRAFCSGLWRWWGSRGLWPCGRIPWHRGYSCVHNCFGLLTQVRLGYWM